MAYLALTAGANGLGLYAWDDRDRDGKGWYTGDHPEAVETLRTVFNELRDLSPILIATNSTHAANEFLYRRLPYDPVRDFAHIGLLGTYATVAVVPADAPYKSIPALIAQARANPGRVFFGYYSSSSLVPAALPWTTTLRGDVTVRFAFTRNTLLEGKMFSIFPVTSNASVGFALLMPTYPEEAMVIVLVVPL